MEQSPTDLEFLSGPANALLNRGQALKRAGT